MENFINNTLQFNFDSVLTMADEGMVKMFQTLEESGLRGFLGVSGSVYEHDLTQFYEKWMFVNGEIVSTVSEFSKTGAPFQTSSNKKDMKVEYRLLNDIVAKSLTAMAGSFDAMTIERFDIMAEISAIIETKVSDEMSTLSCQTAEVVNFLKELGAAKKGESSKKRRLI
ncbi:hypothetical protein F511_30055 [Dorcoceras hygrometricum]|uniref:Uncharacterized protein n=1 Tax=Dorcoceras hygrometricum TaxID=472368 RepID=A0A2Z7BPW4_9LAMI|nr:hypothetical protein F511_30055 [Dorcoceras hygrometricum]